MLPLSRGLTTLASRSLRLRLQPTGLAMRLSSHKHSKGVLVNAFTFNPGIALFRFCNSLVFTPNRRRYACTVLPQQRAARWRNMVTLIGSDLGVNDTTAITLNGVPAYQWWWLDGSTIVVKAAPGGTPGTGPVVINSTSYGTLLVSATPIQVCCYMLWQLVR